MRHFDLAIIGTGSGNSIVGRDFDDWSVAILEHGRFGGTCLNVGCIPTKMFVHPADIASAGSDAAGLGLDVTLDKVHWAAMRDRIFGRVDAIESSGREYRSGERTPNTTVFTGTARFLGPHTLFTGDTNGAVGETITADRIVVAAGGRPVVPELIASSGAPFHTSDSIMRIDDLPESLIIVGGGYIAAEFAHVFASFGTRVTQVVRGDHLLKKHDRDIADRFTEVALARYDLRLGAKLTAMRSTGDGPQPGVEVDIVQDGVSTTVRAELLLVATGRRPNTDLLDAPAAGLAVHKDGRVRVDEYQRTNVPGVFALGDISSDYQLKHVANAEARTVRHNLRHPDHLVATDHRFVPAAVFGHPQVATVGVTEKQARQHGGHPVVVTHTYGAIAAGWAREDTTGFAKLIADPRSGLLIGAHIIGPEAATVIQPLIQAMSFGQPVANLGRGQYWIHPALSELVENALIALQRALRAER